MSPADPASAVGPGAAGGDAVWEDALLAAALFAIDPAGLGGIALRAAPGPARDVWLAAVRERLAPAAPVRRAPLNIADERLLGGLDLAASLAAGRPVAQRGLLAECDGGVILLPMAERIEDAAAARLASALDRGEVVLERDGLASAMAARIGVIALDEGVGPEEAPPRALLERFAFLIDLSAVGGRSVAIGPSVAAVAEGRGRLATVGEASDDIVEGLCAAAEAMGLGSARAPLMALRAARAHAALRGNDGIAVEDAAAAARLVLGPRALIAPTAAPEDAEAAESDAPPPPSEPPTDTAADATPAPDDPAAERPAEADLVLAAIQAALPPDLLEQIAARATRRPAASGARGLGGRTRATRHGRPVGVRQGALRGGDRLDVVETLRAATPWQKLRGGGVTAGRVQVRSQDFRIRRFARRADSTTIFVVDASGSSAFQRLAEVKGAVELMLAKAYVSRTRVALLAFRGVAADLLLPPTRSLTRARRRLAELPGGGGTPLAAGVDAAVTVALAERAMGRTPLLVFLTDGRANIGRGGAAGRAAAESDALVACERIRQAGLAAAWLDTGPRPRPDADRFARAMGAVYAPLPFANATSVFDVVDAVRGGAR